MKSKITINQIKRHEGLSLYPYKCTSGKITIGFGRNIEDRGISEAEADFMLMNDINNCIDELSNCKYANTYNLLDEVRKSVLINMCFNIGLPSLIKFKKMWAALSVGNYETAADEMRDSRWFEQVPRRASELIQQMRTGKYEYEV